MKKNRVVALLLCAALLLSGFTNTMVKAAGATGKQTTTAQKVKNGQAVRVKAVCQVILQL